MPFLDGAQNESRKYNYIYGIIAQAVQAVGNVQKRYGNKHHTLVTGSEVVKKFFDFLSHLLHFIRDISGKIVILVLFLLPFCNIRFNGKKLFLNDFDRFIRRYRLYGDGQHHTP